MKKYLAEAVRMMEEELTQDSFHINNVAVLWKKKYDYWKPLFNEDGRTTINAVRDGQAIIQEHMLNEVKRYFDDCKILYLPDKRIKAHFPAVKAFLNELTMEDIVEGKVDGKRIAKTVRRMLTSYSKKYSTLEIPESHFISQYEYWERMYSNIREEKMNEGKPIKVILSLNPVDLLTPSDDTTGWGSCLSKDSEYAAGVFALMADPNCFIAYVLNAEHEKVGRSLIWLTEERDAIAIGKQYPKTIINHQSLLEGMATALHLEIYEEIDSLDYNLHAALFPNGRGEIDLAFATTPQRDDYYYFGYHRCTNCGTMQAERLDTGDGDYSSPYCVDCSDSFTCERCDGIVSECDYTDHITYGRICRYCAEDIICSHCLQSAADQPNVSMKTGNIIGKKVDDSCGKICEDCVEHFTMIADSQGVERFVEKDLTVEDFFGHRRSTFSTVHVAELFGEEFSKAVAEMLEVQK